jgi:hypothetical protein
MGNDLMLPVPLNQTRDWRIFHKGVFDILVADQTYQFICCEGFRMPAHDDGARHAVGRRPQTSKGGNGAMSDLSPL